MSLRVLAKFLREVERRGPTVALPFPANSVIFIISFNSILLLSSTMVSPPARPPLLEDEKCANSRREGGRFHLKKTIDLTLIVSHGQNHFQVHCPFRNKYLSKKNRENNCMKSTFHPHPPWTDIARPASRQEFHSRARAFLFCSCGEAQGHGTGCVVFVGTTSVSLFYERKVVEKYDNDILQQKNLSS